MWASSCVGILLSLALVAVALVKVRKAHAGGGFMLAGSGATTLLTTCCNRGISAYAQSAGGVESLYTAQSLLSTLAGLVAAVLIIAGFAVMARSAKPAPVGGREA